MKKCLALLLFIAPLAVSAQTGTITYDQVVKMEIELPPEMESMRDQIPTESTSSYVLYFTESETLMKNAPVQEKERRTASTSMITSRRIGFTGTLRQFSTSTHLRSKK